MSFVVKHYQNGRVYYSACDSYVHDTESPVRVDLFSKANGPSTIYVLPGDSVFVENMAGKTLTAIRPRE